MALSIKNQMTRFTKRLSKVIDDFADPKVMKEVAEQALKLVVQQVRLGNDYKTGGKFKELSPDYKDKRKKYSSDLHATARPRKSNVTATGQMLESIEVDKVQARSVTLGLGGARRNSPLSSSKVTNAEVGYWVEYNGRHFFGLAEKSRKKLILFYRRIVRSMLKRTNR